MRRRDPFRDLLAIQNEMNRLFGRTNGGGVLTIEVPKVEQASARRIEVKASQT